MYCLKMQFNLKIIEFLYLSMDYAISLHNFYNSSVLQTQKAVVYISVKKVVQIIVFSNKLSSFFPSFSETKATNSFSGPSKL